MLVERETQRIRAQIISGNYGGKLFIIKYTYFSLIVSVFSYEWDLLKQGQIIIWTMCVVILIVCFLHYMDRSTCIFSYFICLCK